MPGVVRDCQTSQTQTAQLVRSIPHTKQNKTKHTKQNKTRLEAVAAHRVLTLHTQLEIHSFRERYTAKPSQERHGTDDVTMPFRTAALLRFLVLSAVAAPGRPRSCACRRPLRLPSSLVRTGPSPHRTRTRTRTRNRTRTRTRTRSHPRTCSLGNPPLGP